MLVSEKLRQFGTTIFAEMTALATEHKAINLSQGFPDFEGPPEIVDACCDALKAGHNQYSRSMGVPPFAQAVANHVKTCFGLDYDPMTEVGAFCGCTEGLMATMLGFLNPGDEVIFFEPVYDSYPACAAMAQAVPKYCTLQFPDFAVDFAQLESLFSPKTRLLVVNSPHNPTGKVFTQAEMEGIAELCKKHDVYVLTDDVYEQLLYDGLTHIPMASLPGMRERTLSLSSVGKTFSFTGWKVGWATGPANLLKAAQSAHQFITFCTPAPMQLATAKALELADNGDFYVNLRKDYTQRRDFLVKVLQDAGLTVSAPQGTYFALADFSPVFDGDDVAFAKYLTSEIGVAAIPPSFFYPNQKSAGQKLVRFAFCKQMKTSEAAAERLAKLKK